MKSNIKSIIVLPVICLVVAALLATVNYITKPIIERNAYLAEQESLREVLPNSKEFEETLLSENAPETVTGIYKEVGGEGYAVTIETSSSYSKDPMTFTIGISSKGAITGIAVTNYSETKDFGDFPDKFIGKDYTLEGIDLVGGVTYSSKAFRDAVSDAFAAIAEFDPEVGGEVQEHVPYEPDADTLAKVFPEAQGFEKVALFENAPETVTYVYKETGGAGYVAAIEVSSDYSLEPMTAVIGISTDGKIVAIEITNYSESKDFGSYPDSFIGKDSSLEGVDVTAGVTFSSTAFKGAVEDAFKAVEEVAGK